MTKADEAISYILNRVQTDPDLAHHMIGTESHAKLMAAEAERLGQAVDLVRAARTKDLQPRHSRRRARLVEARERIEFLERLICEAGIPIPDTETSDGTEG